MSSGTGDVVVAVGTVVVDSPAGAVVVVGALVLVVASSEVVVADGTLDAGAVVVAGAVEVVAAGVVVVGVDVDVVEVDVVEVDEVVVGAGSTVSVIVMVAVVKSVWFVGVNWAVIVVLPTPTGVTWLPDTVATAVSDEV